MTGALASDSALVPPAVLLPCLIVVLGSKMSLVKVGRAILELERGSVNVLTARRFRKMLPEEVDDERQHQIANRHWHFPGRADRIFPGLKVS